LRTLFGHAPPRRLLERERHRRALGTLVAMNAPVALASTHVGLVGYGEVGQIFAAALVAAGAASVGAWDPLFARPDSGPGLRQRAAANGVVARSGIADLLAHSRWLFCAVTADQTAAVAREAAPSLAAGTVFVDLNSASPKTKTDCAALIGGAGGRYVEAAVMTSVPPHGLAVPMLLGGPHAAAVAPTLRAWGLDATPVSPQWGIASAIKMCRSVIVKGMEALVIESFTAARAFGVEEPVIASLQETFPGIDWNAQADYFFERVIRHGRRRAQEMVEAAATMAETGIGATMATAIAQRQGWVAELARRDAFGAGPSGWRARADAARAAMTTGEAQ
jgi:3-hydroxyisobutyrate dehydrogenase-like beta-hydroxyacid dehydrogenase